MRPVILNSPKSRYNLHLHLSCSCGACHTCCAACTSNIVVLFDVSHLYAIVKIAHIDLMQGPVEIMNINPYGLASEITGSNRSPVGTDCVIVIGTASAANAGTDIDRDIATASAVAKNLRTFFIDKSP